MQDYERGDGTLRNPVLSSGGLIDLVIVIGQQSFPGHLLV